MKTITYKFSAVLEWLSARLKEHKLIFTESYDGYKLNIQYLKVEQGLHFISAQIESNEAICFAQIPELSKDWTIIYILENPLANQNHSAGVYTGFNDSHLTTTFIEGNQISFFAILISKEYLKIYNIESEFNSLCESNDKLNYQSMSFQFREQLQHLKNNVGIIRVKKKITKLIKTYCLEKDIVVNQLFNNIEYLCDSCLKQSSDINMYASIELKLDIESIQKFFYEYFNVTLYEFYYQFRLRNFRFFLRNKTNLNNFLQLSIQSHSPGLKLLSEKFDLSEKQIKKIFVEEFGQSIYVYYRSFRLTLAKEYLVKHKMKVYQVSRILGYSSSSKLTFAFNKYEGYTPKILLRKQS